MPGYKENFMKKILENSFSNDWTKATEEWDIIDFQEDVLMESECICGKNGILYLYKIKNLKTNFVFFPIGSKCIKHFKRTDFNNFISEKETLFKLLDKVKNNDYLSLKGSGFTKKILKYFYEKNVFVPNKFNKNNPEDDYEFLIKMFNKKNEPTEKQSSKIRALIIKNIKPFLINELKNKTNNIILDN